MVNRKDMLMRIPTPSEGQGPAGRYPFRTPLSVVLVPLVLAGSLSSAREAPQSALPDAFRAEDLLWAIDLGAHQYTIPIVDDGQLFIGVNDANLKHSTLRRSGGGMLMRLEPKTGEMVWQMVIPRYEEGNIRPSHFNIWRCGVCSRPAIEGKRLYIVGPRGDVLCLDRNGQTDGNDGPYMKEAEYMEAPADYRLQKTDGDIIWEYNLVHEAGVVPHDVCGSSPLLVGGYLYACTSNGQDNRHSRIVKPEAPALIVLDKETGKLVAVEAEGISKRSYHCNWSSPVAATVRGKPIILFGGGDGILYAFKPVVSSMGEPRPLKKLWQYDCNPKEYRYLDGKERRYSQYNNRTPEGPSEIISIPAVAGGRIYAAIGQSPMHGRGRGMLTCIDAATGRKVWESAKVDRTTAQPAVDGGLVYISDYTGRLHCLDADTGEQYWQHELEGKAWFASPVVVDGKVYMSTERRTLWILKAGKEKKVLGKSRFKSPAITLMAHDGVLYLPTQRRLFAVKM